MLRVGRDSERLPGGGRLMPSKAREAAVRARLSPQTDAIISGPGRVLLIQGHRLLSLSDREARKFAEELRLYGDLRPEAPSDEAAEKPQEPLSRAGDG